MTLRLIVWLSAALGLASCGGGGDTETGAGSTGETGDTETGEPVKDVPFEEFHEAAEVAFCAWQVGCGQYGVNARCRDVNHMEVRLSMQRLSGVGPVEGVPIDYLKEAIAVGRIVYDKEKAAACLEFVRARTCDVVHTWTEEELAGQAACAGVFTGRMGRNGPCVAAAECAEASVCGFDPNCTATEMCCVGACRVLAQPAAVGEPCTGQVTCEADAYCVFDPNLGMATVCKAAPKLGQACPDGACATGSFCDYDDNDGTAVCRAPQAEGAECSYADDECVAPLLCVYDGNFVSHCYQPRDAGEPCNPETSGPQCLRVDHGCDAGTRKCAPLPGNGESCPNYQCQGDLFCSSVAGQRCVPVADEKEGCGYKPNTGDEVPCSGDHACVGDFESEVCVAPGGGATCPVPADPGAA